jgi:hypothetical protein
MVLKKRRLGGAYVRWPEGRALDDFADRIMD